MAKVPDNAIHPITRADWRDWLVRCHENAAGVWLVTYRKASGKPRLSYEDCVEEALCVGWVDSKPRKLDADRTMLWFSPRQPGSGWSAPNKARVEKLIAAGLMLPAGLAKVEAARQDGSWTLLDDVEALVIPPDLGQALDALPDAREYFDAFPRSIKRGILEWIVLAKRHGTRARRIEVTATLAARNVRANQWQP